MRSIVKSIGLSALIFFAAGISRASEIPVEWVGGTGYWYVSGNWDPDVVPNNSNGTKYAVTINKTGSEVSIANKKFYTVNSLTNYNTLILQQGSLTTVEPEALANYGTVYTKNSMYIPWNPDAPTINGDVYNYGLVKIDGAKGPGRYSPTLVNGATLLASGTWTNNGEVRVTSARSLNYYHPGYFRAKGDLVLTGTGSLNLVEEDWVFFWDSGSHLQTEAGMTITNDTDHTIGGYGCVDATLINYGTIDANLGNTLYLKSGAKTNNGLITASNGTAQISTTIDNSNGIIDGGNGKVVFASNGIVDGGTLTGTGELQAMGGTLKNITIDDGTTLDVRYSNQSGQSNVSYGSGTWTNNGTIKVTSGGYWTYHTYLRASEDLTLQGSGNLLLNEWKGDSYLQTTGDATITNSAGHTIEGGGIITAALINEGTVAAYDTLQFKSADKTNNGLFKATNRGSLYLREVNVDGTGSWLADNGKIRVQYNSNITTTGDIEVINGGELEISHATMTGGNLWIDETSSISVSSTLSLSGNFDFAMTDQSKWMFSSDAILEMTGGQGGYPGNWSEWARLEVGCENGGENPPYEWGDGYGYTSNFHLENLILADGAHIFLADLIDNGNREGGLAEMLYVRNLILGEDSMLNTNGLSLYYEVLTGDPSFIINAQVPIPSSVFLLGSGLIGLLRFRGKSRKK